MRLIRPLFFLSICLALAGCSPILAQQEKLASQKPTLNLTPNPPTETPQVTPTIKGTPGSGASLIEGLPGKPHGPAQIIHDQISQGTASEKKAPGGDEYPDGRFERPFDSDMTYLPSLDIVRAELVRPGIGLGLFHNLPERYAFSRACNIRGGIGPEYRRPRRLPDPVHGSNR